MLGIGATLKKLFILATFVPLMLFVLREAGWADGQVYLFIATFIGGMLFPDIDVITGFIRTSFQTVLLLLFVALAVLAFPQMWALGQPYCPIPTVNQYLPDLDALVACQVGLALIAVGVANVAAGLAVMWIPQKDSFHHWTSAILFSGGLAMLGRITQLSEHYDTMGLGFGIGYGLHLLADKGPEFLPSKPRDLAGGAGKAIKKFAN